MATHEYSHDVFRWWVDSLYRAMPNLNRYFDGVAMHDYGSDATHLAPIRAGLPVRELRPDPPDRGRARPVRAPPCGQQAVLDHGAGLHDLSPAQRRLSLGVRPGRRPAHDVRLHHAAAIAAGCSRCSCIRYEEPEPGPVSMTATGCCAPTARRSRRWPCSSHSRSRRAEPEPARRGARPFKARAIRSKLVT